MSQFNRQINQVACSVNSEAQPIIPPDLREKPRSPVNSKVSRHPHG